MPKRSKPNECAQDEIEPLYEQLVTPLRRKQAGSAEGRQSAPKTPKKRQYEPKECSKDEDQPSSSSEYKQLVTRAKRKLPWSTAGHELQPKTPTPKKARRTFSDAFRLDCAQQYQAWIELGKPKRFSPGKLLEEQYDVTKILRGSAMKP